MPKVLRIINRFNLGGITYNVTYLTRHLPGDFETLLVGGPEEAGEDSSLHIPQSLGVQPVIIPAMRRKLSILSDYRAYREICRIIRSFRPDIVHTHASKAGALGRLAAFTCRVPVVVHTFHGHVFHGYFSPWRSGLVKAIERWLARKTDAIVAISQLQKKEITEVHRICQEGKVHVIKLGFDLKRFTESMESKREAFRAKYRLQGTVIGIIGRLVPIKNHRLFLRAFAAVKNNCATSIQAVIVGDGTLRSGLEQYARSLGLTVGNGEGTSDVVFSGWVRQADEVLAGCDIVCLTSDNEGTPVSLIEAQAAGKFIVTTEVGGVRDILHPSSGLLSAPGDTDAFATNLRYAVEHFADIENLAKLGSESALKTFSFERLCVEMATLYTHLLQTRSLRKVSRR